MLQQRAIGVSLPRDIPASQIIEFCQRAERLGFDELWIVEDLFYRGGIAQAAIALASTSTIHVGIGILPAAARNVAFAALEVATLAEVYPGRVTVGIGHGVTDWIKEVGAWPKSPLGLLRETLSALRALLHGSTVDVTGDYVSLRDARLEFPPAQPPLVLAGVRGPKSLAISGAHADGTALAEPVTPEYIARVLEQVGATGPHRIVAYSNAVVAESLEDARSIARPYLAHIDSPDVAAHIDPLPFAAALRELGRTAPTPDAFAAAMPGEWVDQLAIVGTAADVRARVGVLQDAGANSVVFIITGPDALLALDSLGTAL